MSTNQKLLESFVVIDKFLQLLNMTNSGKCTVANEKNSHKKSQCCHSFQISKFIAEAERVICDPARLSEIMSQTDVTAISEMLCNSTATLQKVLDVLRNTLNKQRIEDLVCPNADFLLFIVLKY